MFPRTACRPCSGNLQKLLLRDRLGKSGIEILEIRARRRRELTSGGQNSRAGDTAFIDYIPKRSIAVQAGVAEIAHRSEATLQVFSCQLRAPATPAHWATS